MKFLTIHWSLDCRKNEGCYLIDASGKKVDVTWQEAYKAFIAGKKPRSPWYDDQVERRLQGGAPRQSISQELDIDYVASGALAFREEKIKEGWERARDPLQRLEVDANVWLMEERIEGRKKKKIWEVVDDSLCQSQNGRIWVWETPQAGIPYGIFVDPAENLTLGSDKSAIAVVNTISGNIVCTGRGEWQPDELGIVASILGYWYNEALLAVEYNSVGMSVLTVITGRIAIRQEDDIDALRASWLYNRLYTEWIDDHQAKTKTTRLGLRTSRIAKRQLVTLQYRYMESGVEYCADRRYWEECLGFVEEEGGKLGNPSGDDMVISVGGALFIVQDARLYPPIQRRQAKNRVADMKRFAALAKSENWKAISSKIKIKAKV